MQYEKYAIKSRRSDDASDYGFLNGSFLPLFNSPAEDNITMNRKNERFRQWAWKNQFF